MASLSYIGYIFALIGAIIIILTGLLSIIGSPFLAFFSPIGAIGLLGGGIVRLILGVICAVGAKYVRHLGWMIVLIVLGIIAGGPGGLLVVLGALIGLIAKLTNE